MPGAIPEPDEISHASNLLLSGEVVAAGTDTVPGLLASPTAPTAPYQLNRIKGRRRTQPVAMIVPYASNAHANLATSAYQHGLGKYFPGPLTMIVKHTRAAQITGVNSTLLPFSTIGLRVVASRWLSSLIEESGGALWATSANPSGAEPSLETVPRGAVKMRSQYRGLGVSSMVIDLTSGDDPEVLREFDPAGIRPRQQLSREHPLRRAHRKLHLPDLFDRTG